MAKLTFRSDEMQWEDTFLYDEKTENMVPSIKIGDVIQIQIEAWSYEIRNWAYFMPEQKKDVPIERRFSQLGPDKSFYSLHGVVKKIYKEKREKMLEKPYARIWEALLDCGIPIVVIGYIEEAERISAPINEGCIVECNTPLNGAISFYKGKFFNPIAGKILDIGETIHEIPAWVKGINKYNALVTSGYKLMTIGTSITEPIKHCVDYI